MSEPPILMYMQSMAVAYVRMCIHVHLLCVCQGLTHCVIHMHAHALEVNCLHTHVHVYVYACTPSEEYSYMQLGCAVSQEQAECDFGCQLSKGSGILNNYSGFQTVPRASGRLLQIFDVATCTCTCTCMCATCMPVLQHSLPYNMFTLHVYAMDMGYA